VGWPGKWAAMGHRLSDGQCADSQAGTRRMKMLWQVSKAAIEGWKADFASSMGAALAYYTVFSIAPLLVIVIAIAALAFGHATAQQEIMAQARELIGDQGADAL